MLAFSGVATHSHSGSYLGYAVSAELQGKACHELMGRARKTVASHTNHKATRVIRLSCISLYKPGTGQ